MNTQHLNCHLFQTGTVKWLTHIRVSNGMGHCNFSGQRDRSFFVVPGQRDNRTSSKSCHGRGQAGTASQNPGRDVGRDRVLIFCHGTGRDRGVCPGTGRAGTASQNSGRDVGQDRVFFLSRDKETAGQENFLSRPLETLTHIQHPTH